MMYTTPYPNPLQRARVRLGYASAERFARKANVQKSFIGQADQGFFVDPPPSYLEALNIFPGTEEEEEITKAYHLFQKERRLSNGPINNTDPKHPERNLSKLIINPIFRFDQNPLKSWRVQSRLSVYGLCTAYCLHMPTVNNIENKIYNIIEMPINIIHPLEEAGFGIIDGLLEEFEETFHLHKQYLQDYLLKINNLEKQSNN